jgi:predicted secreted protein
MTDRARLAISILALVLSAGVLAAVIVVERIPILDLLPKPPVAVTEKNQGDVVHLARGQRLAVTLRGNSLSGATWRANIPVSFLEQDSVVTFQPDAKPASPGDGVQTMTFRATGAGQGPLFLNYATESDQNSLKPTRTFSVVVVVQ